MGLPAPNGKGECTCGLLAKLADDPLNCCLRHFFEAQVDCGSSQNHGYVLRFYQRRGWRLIVCPLVFSGERNAMKNRAIRKPIWFGLILCSISFCVSGEDFTNAIHAFLQQRIEAEKSDVGVVVGIVDEQGSSVISCGKLDNGTDQEVTGDTLFEIGSITKTFTALLLQGMIERGEMNLNDPVGTYLPKSVKMPEHKGKQITLLHLVTHTSGLPRNPDNPATKREEHPLENYTDEMLNEFLSSYQLTRNPGARFEYSNLGMGLLGNTIALKAGKRYESLLTDRICQSLKMNSTAITLNPELKSRFAAGHNEFGYGVPSCDFQSLMGCGAIRSTANDLLRYLSANLGLTRSSLTPLMQKTHVVHFQSMFRPSSIGLAWFIAGEPKGKNIIWHSGATPGFCTFAGFDKSQHRGVVVLSSSCDANIFLIGMLLLKSEWQSSSRPTEKNISNEDFGSYIGKYKLSPNFALGKWIIEIILKRAPAAIILIPTAIAVAVLAFVLWRAASFRKGCVILGCFLVFDCVLAILGVLVASCLFCAVLSPGFGMRQQGDRILIQASMQLSPFVNKLWPGAAQFRPQLTGELLPVTKHQCFERLTGTPIAVSRDGVGKASRLTLQFLGAQLSFHRVYDQPPKPFEQPKPHVAIKLDTNLLEACVGDYEFAPNDTLPEGAKVRIWREEDQLVGQAQGKNTLKLPFNIYAESQTNFFLKINGAELNFIKNDNGEVTSVMHHIAGLPDSEGKKLENK